MSAPRQFGKCTQRRAAESSSLSACARRFGLLCLLIGSSLSAPALTQQEPPATAERAGSNELAHAVESVLVEKCGECHSPEADEKKAKRHLSNVGDLKVVIEESVAPFDLELSDLWVSIEEESMPPEDALKGPLTLAERELVRAWILAGAPLPAEAPKAQVAAEVTLSPTSQLRLYAGRAHPGLLHFPIALLCTAGFLELCGLFTRRNQRCYECARLLLRLVLLTAPLAALSGWFFAAESSAQSELEWHKRLGIALALLVLPLVWTSEKCAGSTKRGLYRLLLVAACLLVTLTAHLGGELVYGADFLPF